jgi:hypothetical protein
MAMLQPHNTPYPQKIQTLLPLLALEQQVFGVSLYKQISIEITDWGSLCFQYTNNLLATIIA